MDKKIKLKDLIYLGIVIASLVFAGIKQEINIKLKNVLSYAHKQTEIVQQNNYYFNSPESLKAYIDNINAATGPVSKLEIK